QKCREAIVKGKLSADTECHADEKTAAAIDKARTKLGATIGKACAGKDKSCGTGDTGEPALADIGWDIGTGPNFEDGSCTNAIDDCSGVATCLECIGEAAVDQAIALYYAPTPADPKLDKDVNKCQLAIGKASAKFLAAKSQALAKCWAAV